MDTTRRFTGRQITTIAVAAAVAVVAAPVGALAATGSLINIADPSNAKQVAHVDAGGRLEVGDGSGALTVDGTVSTRAADQTVTLWSYQLIPANGYRSPHLPVANYGQVRIAFTNVSSGPCEVWASSSDSVYAASTLYDFTLAGPSFSPQASTVVLDVPGRTLWVGSRNCQAEVEIYGRP